MTKLEKLQKEYPMFELAIKPAPEYLKEIYIEAGCDEPKRMLVFSWKGPNSEDIGTYSDYVGAYEWSISTLRKNLDRWASKI